ncbi:MAG: zinc ribbon domain-containing protein [Clostridiaceae bacterium]|nr:zinc ribbon domain-containing protein [Clostridiaceae bacterium]
MQFFENLGKKVGEAAQAAAKKSSELVEITKLNASINSEEDKIQKLYSQIGKTIFENFEQTGTADDAVKEACVQITEHMANIKAYREKIAELKGIKSCINCGAEMERTQLFCGKCGTKNELPQDDTAAPAAEQPAKPTCPSCNAEVGEGAAFCTNCGTKL